MENQKQLAEEIKWISSVQAQLEQLVNSPELPDHLRPKREHDLKMSTAIKQRLNGLSTPVKWKLYHRFIDVYIEFYVKAVGVKKPDITEADGRALKQIIKYLVEISPDNTEEQALESWQFIFYKWNTFNDFLKSKKKLMEMRKYIGELVDKSKNGTTNEKKGADRRADLKAELGRK